MGSNSFSPTAASFMSDTDTALLTGPVLVATDGSAASEAAFAAASVIARTTGASVEVASVIELGMPPMLAPEFAMAMREAEEAEERRRMERIHRQMRAHLGDVAAELHVEFGHAPAAIAALAHDRHAALIVAAFGRHGIVYRLLGTETPLRIARVANVPVLCVPPGFARMPRVVVVTVDFGVECVRAAAAARALLGSATHVHLVHVKPNDRLDMPADVLAEWERSYERELDDAFRRVTEVLGLSPDVGVTTMVVRGTPARELLDVAASVHADLLVAGHGHRGRLERLLGGSVASKLFRGAQCALLLAPEVAPETRLPESPEGSATDVLRDRGRWLGELARFTERNAGRAATVEIDDPRLGAQVIARDFPFRGADYDRRDDAVEIVLGAERGQGGHLAHVVRAPVSIAIHRAPDGRDRVLRVETPEGQVMVVLASG